MAATITTHDAHTITNAATGNHLHVTEDGKLQANSKEKGHHHAHKIHHRGRHHKTHHVAIQHHNTGKFVAAGKTTADDSGDGPDHALWAAISHDAASGTHVLHHVGTDQILIHHDDGEVKAVPKTEAAVQNPNAQWVIAPTTVPPTTVVANVTPGAKPEEQPQPPHPTAPAPGAPAAK